MRPGEPAGGLFESVFTTDEIAEATSDRACVAAMLDFEAALAAAEAKAGLVPAGAAVLICQRCREIDLDPVALGRAGRLGANPAIPLVEALRSQLPPEIAGWAHFGATSQDVIDTALMLVLRRVIDLALGDLGRLAGATAELAERHRATPMVARTLLQHALPTTFGRKAAGWLVAAVEAGEGLRRVRQHRLAVQLGGAAGTLAALGERAPLVVEALAAELGLEVPVLPWHADRTRVVQISGALALCAGVAGKVALDVSLLMQNEVGEAFEPPAERRGASSALPHKRNPAMAAEVLAANRRAQGLAGILLGGAPHEHERAVGAWQSEWQTLLELSRAAGGAISVAADMVSGLQLDTARMTRNLELTRGLVLAERLKSVLAPALGPDEASRAVQEASRRAALASTSLEEELSSVPKIAELLPGLPGDLFDPAGWLGSAELFVDRALELYREAGRDD